LAGRHRSVRSRARRGPTPCPWPHFKSICPGTATADWADPTPGDLRVDHILPSRSLAIGRAGVT